MALPLLAAEAGGITLRRKGQLKEKGPSPLAQGRGRKTDAESILSTTSGVKKKR